MVAQVALIGFSFFCTDVQTRAAVTHNRTHDHFHCAVRTSHNASFTANAAFLHYVNKTFIAADRTVRADVSARRVFTLAAQRRRRDINAFDDVNAG